MLTVIVARTEDEADEAAFNLGLQWQEWVYPDSPFKLRDSEPIGQVVWVSGWESSAVLTTLALDQLRLRMVTDEPAELQQLTTAEFLTPREIPGSPFVDLFAPDPGLRRRPLLRRLARALRRAFRWAW